MTNDQKQQNEIFKKECRKLWLEAHERLKSLVGKSCVVLENIKQQRMEVADGKIGGNDTSSTSGSVGMRLSNSDSKDSKEVKEISTSAEEKGGMTNKTVVTPTPTSTITDLNSVNVKSVISDILSESKSESVLHTEISIPDDKETKENNGIKLNSVDKNITTSYEYTGSKIESFVLNDLCMRRLKEWVEEDEEEELQVELQKKLEKKTEAKKLHQQFVKKKDELRIRLPQTSVLPKSTKHSTTVEMLADSGMKYVYAHEKGT